MISQYHQYYSSRIIFPTWPLTGHSLQDKEVLHATIKIALKDGLINPIFYVNYPPTPESGHDWTN